MNKTNIDFDVKPYVFRTARERLPSKIGSKYSETKDQLKDNNSFEIKFFIPALPSHEIKDIVIIVNGFNEMSIETYHRKKSGICSLLANRGIASVLVPIPFHMNRMPKGIYPKNHEPKHLVNDEKDRFYEGYRQLVDDVEKLGKMLCGIGYKDEIVFEDDAKLCDFLRKDLKVHLFGYSIGGLGVLSALIKIHFEKIPNLFNTCVLLSSGADFNTLHPEEMIGLEEDTWKRIKHFYLGKVYKKAESKKSLMNRIFEMTLLGERNDLFRDTIRDLSNRILAVVGAMDNVNHPTSIDRFEPEETGLAIIKVPSLEHKFASRGWIAWHNWVMDCVISFIREHPSKVVKTGFYRRTTIKKALNRTIMTTKSEKVLNAAEKLANFWQKDR